jgi:hypothetical protein
MGDGLVLVESEPWAIVPHGEKPLKGIGPTREDLSSGSMEGPCG